MYGKAVVVLTNGAIRIFESINEADIAKGKDEFDGVVRLFKKLWKKYAASDSGLCIGRTTY